MEFPFWSEAGETAATKDKIKETETHVGHKLLGFDRNVEVFLLTEMPKILLKTVTFTPSLKNLLRLRLLRLKVRVS